MANRNPEQYTIGFLKEMAVKRQDHQIQYLDKINIPLMNQKEIQSLSANIQSLITEAQQRFKIILSRVIEERKKQLKQDKKQLDQKIQRRKIYFIAVLVPLLVTFTTLISFFQPTIVAVPQGGQIKSAAIQLEKFIPGGIGLVIVIAIGIWAYCVFKNENEE